LKDDSNIFILFLGLYSQIWLNLPRDDDSNFFYIFPWMIATLATNKNFPEKPKQWGLFINWGYCLIHTKNVKKKKKK
jgi:hypothetical protein